MPMTVVRESTLFSTETQDSQAVWMSHGDEAVKLPEGFSVVARSEQGSIVAIEHPGRRIFGLQYHPEVVHRCGCVWVCACVRSCRQLFRRQLRHYCSRAAAASVCEAVVKQWQQAGRCHAASHLAACIHRLLLAAGG